MIEFHPIMVCIESSHDVPAGIIPVDDVVVIGPRVPTNLEIKIEAVREYERSFKVLHTDAIE